MKVQKYGWEYSARIEDKKFFFSVTPPDEDYQKPDRLYKFLSLNKYTIDGLLQNYVYATHPSQFNDIFDCHEGLIEFDDPKVVRDFLGGVFDKKTVDKYIQHDYNNSKLFVQRNFREILYRKIGVLSMTSNPNSILMWSYYTNHSGILVEYDIEKFPFKFHGPFPVNYQGNIAPASISEVGVPLAVLLQTNVKYNGWEHEDEWRLLIDSEKDMYSPNFEDLRKLGGEDRKFKYPESAIKSVALGNRFFLPEEIKVEDDDSLIIELKENLEQKTLVLDFLASNEINTLMVLRDGLMKIGYRPNQCSRLNYKMFKITPTN